MMDFGQKQETILPDFFYQDGYLDFLGLDDPIEENLFDDFDLSLLEDCPEDHFFDHDSYNMLY